MAMGLPLESCEDKPQLPCSSSYVWRRRCHVHNNHRTSHNRCIRGQTHRSCLLHRLSRPFSCGRSSWPMLSKLDPESSIRHLCRQDGNTASHQLLSFGIEPFRYEWCSHGAQSARSHNLECPLFLTALSVIMVSDDEGGSYCASERKEIRAKVWLWSSRGLDLC